MNPFFRFFIRFSPPLLLLLLCGGCGPATLEQAMESGGKRISMTEQRALLTDRTIHLEASAFDATVSLQGDGSLSAYSYDKDRDTGSWDVRDDQLCIRFARWNFNDTSCFIPVRVDENTLLLFSRGGAYQMRATLRGPITTTSAFTPSSNRSQNDSGAHRRHTTDISGALPQHHNPTPGTQAARYTLVNLARKCPDCNLSGSDLSKANLIGAELEGANLESCDFTDANLRRANLQRANLQGATLLRTNLAGANLRQARLRNANLHGANLIFADLTGADLTNADLSGIHTESTKGLP